MFYVKGGFKARDARRITIVDMNYVYMRNTTGFTGTGYKTNTDIAKEM
jgi:hypothetical protein